MREALRQGLEEENHTVALASDGLEGLHAAETCDFDAILLDVMMPGMDGVDLVRRLRAAGRQTPVLMLTARDAAGDVVRRLDAGTDDYLTKTLLFPRTACPLACHLPALGPAAQSPLASRRSGARPDVARGIARWCGFEPHGGRIPCARIPDAARGPRRLPIRDYRRRVGIRGGD